MDNDGVLTDGGLIYGAEGIEQARFDVKDGLGIKLAQKAGLITGIISGLGSEALRKRAKTLGVEDFHTNVSDKLEVYNKFKMKHGLEDDNIAFIGDDVIDIPIMIRCGLSVAVADAHTEVKKIAHLVTRKPGGHGAVRELIDYILKTQGHWKTVIKKYYD
jgi:3-deoxy-D-manno-octulosonate 8-phosphate phosphatase (KDO 8-P phosphatase)